MAKYKNSVAWESETSGSWTDVPEPPGTQLGREGPLSSPGRVVFGVNNVHEEVGHDPGCVPSREGDPGPSDTLFDQPRRTTQSTSTSNVSAPGVTQPLFWLSSKFVSGDLHVRSPSLRMY